MIQHAFNIASILLAFGFLLMGSPWIALLLGLVFVVSTPRAIPQR